MTLFNAEERYIENLCLNFRTKEKYIENPNSRFRGRGDRRDPEVDVV